VNNQYILRAQSGASVDATVLAERLSAFEGVQVLDRSPKMLLVSGAHASVLRGVEGVTGWTLIPNGVVTLPDVRQKIRQAARR
jgi:hypothetical protein